MTPRLVPALTALALLLLPGAAAAATIEADSSDYPTVRATFVTNAPTAAAPTVTEDGQPLADVTATNLGRAKSIVLAVDRSQTMTGQPLADAVSAARAFVAAKPDEDRIAVATFASEAIMLTGFQTSTTDADGALRTLSIDDVKGTRLFDAVVLSANQLATETYLGRVVIIVTDGHATHNENSLEETIAAAQKAGVSVYVVGIESRRFNPEPLHQLAEETGGSYFAAASTAALDDVYRSIADELTRTWRLEYVTAALPGEKVTVKASLGSETATAQLVAPGATVIRRTPQVEGRLPEQFFGSVWGQAAFAAVIGLLVLLASGFLFASPKGAWLKGRLEPHVAMRRHAAKPSAGERLKMASTLLHATEATLGNFKPWKRVQQLLERADLPLRTAEFFYIILGAGLLAGLLAAGAGLPVWALGLMMIAGGFLPYGFLVVKARRRVRAFEAQLPDLLVTMAAGLKAGHSFRQALQSVVDEDQPPASKELKRVLTETRLGRPMDEALVEMAQRIGSKNFEFVITAVTIQRQVGGSLAGLFDMVADTVRNRQQFAKKIKGLTAMGRASSYVLVALPFFVAAMLTMLNSEYMSPLWHTGTGHMLIAVMLVMMGIGSLILRKIVNFRY